MDMGEPSLSRKKTGEDSTIREALINAAMRSFAA